MTPRLAHGGLWAAGTGFILERYTDDPETMIQLFCQFALPDGVVLKLMAPGSIIICILQVNDLNGLHTLWQNYKSGLLKKHLEYVLITEDLCKLARDEIIMGVFLEEKMYHDVCLELTLNQKKGKVLTTDPLSFLGS